MENNYYCVFMLFVITTNYAVANVTSATTTDSSTEVLDLEVTTLASSVDNYTIESVTDISTTESESGTYSTESENETYTTEWTTNAASTAFAEISITTTEIESNSTTTDYTIISSTTFTNDDVTTNTMIDSSTDWAVNESSTLEITLELEPERPMKSLTKCCPANEIIKFGEDPEVSSYECIATFGTEPTLKLYNINVMDESVINNECESRLQEIYLNDSLEFSRLFEHPGSCVDIIEEDGDGYGFIALICETNNTVSSSSPELFYEVPDLKKIQKCCDHGEHYDIYKKICVAQSPDAEDAFFDSFFQNASGIVIPGPGKKCNIQVEHLSDIGNLQLNHSRNGTQLGIEEDRIEQPDFCMDIVTNESYALEYRTKPKKPIWMAKVCHPEPQNVCDRMPCVTKCCPDNRLLYRDSIYTECTLNTTSSAFGIGFRPTFDPSKPLPLVFGIVHNNLIEKCDRAYHLHVGENGSIINPQTGGIRILNGNSPKEIGRDDYCLDNLILSEERGTVHIVIMCFDKDANFMPEMKSKIHVYLLILSCVSLAVTMLYYIVAKKLANLNGKTLFCYIFCLFCAYLGLAITKSIQFEGTKSCIIVGYLIYFSLVSTFLWLNVLCYDIFRSFGMSRNQRTARYYNRRFIYYSIYAWSAAIALTTTTYLFDKYKWVSRDYQPKIGETSCFFSDSLGKANIVFLILPIAIIIFVNIVLYIRTAIYCMEIKSDLNRMSTRYSVGKAKQNQQFKENRKRYLMNLKLFVVMGVFWIFEVASSLLRDNSPIFIFTDCLIALQGVYILLIFVCKKKVYRLILQKISWSGKYLRPTSSMFSSTSGRYELSRMESIR